MSAIDDVLKANEESTQGFSLWRLKRIPARRLAIVCCMDARINVEQSLALATGDAHIIRNAGGVVTEDVLRSLIVSHHELDTREVMIINHTECGALGLVDTAFRARLEQETGRSAETPGSFLGFSDLEQHVGEQVAKVKAHPWLQDVVVRGFVYHVKSGKLREITQGAVAAKLRTRR